MSLPAVLPARYAAGQVILGEPTLVATWPTGAAHDPVTFRVLDVPTARCDSGQVARRQVSVIVPSRDVPKDLGPSTLFRVSCLVRGADRTTDDVTQLVGHLAVAPSDDAPGTVRLDLESREALLRRHGFLVARSFSGTALSCLRGLVGESIPGEPVQFQGVEDQPIATFEVDPGDDARWQTIARFAATMGAEFGANRGGAFRLVPIEATDRRTWIVYEGINAGPVSLPPAGPRVNAVRVNATDEEASGQWGLAVDDRPGSATFVGADTISQFLANPRDDLIASRVGTPLTTRVVSLPVWSEVAAAAAGRALIIRGDRDADVTVEIAGYPRLDWGDRIVHYSADGRALSMIVTGFDIPVLPSPTLAVTGRQE